MNPRPSGAPGFGAVALFVALTLFAAALQTTLSAPLRFWGGQPDFLLTAALVAALLSDATVGCLCGAWAGLLSAAVVGETMGTYLVSRALAGFAAGQSTTRLFRGNIGVILLGVFLASVGAEIAYGLSAPRLTVLHGVAWGRAVLIGAAMNAVFALPTAALLRRCGWGKGRV